MNKEQEGKFERWNDSVLGQPNSDYIMKKMAWAACLVANGINTEEPVKDKTTAVPECVIEMMRTGKAVPCVAWSIDTNKQYVQITGYDINDEFPFIGVDENGSYNRWEHAEPIPAWQPQDGEAVLTPVMGYAEIGYVRSGNVLVRTHKMPIEEAECKPLDESKLGWLWSEI